MKLRNFFAICCVAITMSSCYSNEDFIESASDTSLPIELYNEIIQVPTTRVNDEGFCDGDAVGIYVVNFENGASGTLQTDGNQADNVKFVYDEANLKWIPDNPIYYIDKSTHVDIIGYYPYANPSDVNAYSFELQKDQSKSAENGALGGYEASDFLWGKAADITPTAARVNIKFHHRMAGVQISLIEGTGWSDGEWTQIEKSALVTNTKRKSTIDLATGIVTAIGDVPSVGTVPYIQGTDFRAVVVPQSIAAGVAMISLTIDGIPYVYRHKDVNGTAIDFEYLSGKLHKFNIEVSKKPQSGGLEFKLLGSSITAWESDTISHDGTAREYVVINIPAGSSLAQAIEASGKDYTKIKNLKVVGKTSSSDFFFMRDAMTMLQSVNMKDAEVDRIPDYAFNGKSSLVRFVFPDSITEIGYGAFSGTNLTGSLIIPNSVKTIKNTAFSGLTSLTGTLTLSSSLTHIGDSAFADCGFTGSLDIPKTVVSIDNFAFVRCNFTGSLTLPENLEVLGADAFNHCRYLSGTVKIPSKITSIPERVFAGCAMLDELILHDNITTIGDSAFNYCYFRGPLKLPKNLISIGPSAFRANNFSGSLVLPGELASISAWAFADNPRITGVLEITNNITNIANETFSSCTSLEGVILPKSIESIGENAFNNCFQLNSITCKAIVPPTLSASAFNGVAKDNFVLEVPEASVADYTLAPNWKEFKRIAAHREFSISRNLFRILNAEDSKTLILRAESGAAWSVESCPDWITVTPSSGVGKTEVTISVNEMSVGDVSTFNVETYDSWGSTTSTTYNGRAGEVVFLLEGKDYRTRTKVEQYDYQYGDGDVITNQTASKGKGVNIVFMGDCFDAQDIATGKYLNGINEAIEHFFAVEPYATYKDYFNVYTVFGLSADSGVGSVNTIREAKFGSQYGLQAAGSVGVDKNICFEYACKTPTVTTDNICQTPIVLIENTSEYDGITYMWGDGSAVALVPMSQDEYPYDFRGVLQHEAGGHAFGKLGDEYIYHNAFIQTCDCTCCTHTKEFNQMKSLGFYKNLSLTGNMYEVPWAHLIFDEKYQNTVDIYEGGYYHTRGVFRSEQNSCMNNNIPYFSAISRQAIVERIMEYAGETFSYEAWKANDKALYTGESSVATRSSASQHIPYVHREQQAPKFMGEKPNLNFNK